MTVSFQPKHLLNRKASACLSHGTCLPLIIEKDDGLTGQPDGRLRGNLPTMGLNYRHGQDQESLG